MAAGTFAVSYAMRGFDTDNPSHTEQSSTGQGVVDARRAASDITITTASSSAGPIAGGAATTETITIGADMWVKGLSPFEGPLPGAPAPKPWAHLARSGSAARSTFLGLDPTSMLASLKSKGATLSRIGPDTVRGVGTDHYKVTVPVVTTSTRAFLDTARLEVWIDASDLVRRFRVTESLRAPPGDTQPVPAETLEETIEFFNFGNAVTITPPPSDQVMELPSAPPCGKSNATATTAAAVSACTGSSGTSTTVPKLPPPTVRGRSPLQFRPVLSTQPAGPCPTASDNPPAEQPVTLPGPGNTCYQLAGAAQTVTHAAARAEVDPSTGELEVSVTLDAADAAAFDRLASADYQRQVATVMFGRVLSAPMINATQFDGRLVLTPIDPQTAANVIVALAG